MSVDVRFIANFITEDVDIFNEDVVLVEDDTRRDFLRKLSGYAVSGAINDPAKLLSSIASGSVSGGALTAVAKTLTNMSNDDLSETPEELWLPYITGARLKNFLSENPDHFKFEAVNKFYTVVSYLNSGESVDLVKLETAKKLLSDMQRGGLNVNVSKELNAVFREDAPWHFSYLFMRSKPQDIIRAAKSVGVSLDIGMVQDFAVRAKEVIDQEEAEKLEYDAQEEIHRRARDLQKETDKADWAATVHGGVEPGDELGVERYKYGPKFESKYR